MTNFGANFLPAQRLTFGTLWIMRYTNLVLRLRSGIFGLSLQRKTLALWGVKTGRFHISPMPAHSPKIRKTGHFGAKNLPKTHSKHFSRVWDKKNMAKKPDFSKSKNGHFGGPWAGRMGRMGQKGVAKFCFGPRRTSGASFVKIGVGPRTAHLIDSVHLSCIHS